MNGGRLILRIKRGFENRVWEELLLHYLSDDNPSLEGICGIVLQYFYARLPILKKTLS
jgi:translation initiation factor 4E